MNDNLDLNRLEYLILDTMNENGCTDHFHSMTITDLMGLNEGGLGARMTVYRKMKKLMDAGYINQGCLDDHAHTFYLLEKGKKLFEGGNGE